MDTERVDLSVLDPTRDAVLWRGLVHAIARQGFEARRRRLSVSGMLTLWARPFAAAAAVAAGIALAVSVVGARSRPESSTARSDPVLEVLNWANSDRLPEPGTVLRVLGGSHERN